MRIIHLSDKTVGLTACNQRLAGTYSANDLPQAIRQLEYNSANVLCEECWLTQVMSIPWDVDNDVEDIIDAEEIRQEPCMYYTNTIDGEYVCTLPKHHLGVHQESQLAK